MNLNDSQIGRISRRYLDDNLRSLEPGGVPVPFMLVGGPHGVQHVELHPLSDTDFVATAQTVIPAFIVSAEAVEVALTAFTIDPEVCAGRIECAFIAHWGPGGRDLFTAAVTRRRSQPPVLSEWLRGPSSAGLGPFDEAVHDGLNLAHRIWAPDADLLRQRIDAIRSAAKTKDTDVLPLTVDALREWGWLN
mgnify:CR=1 FL=1